MRVKTILNRIEKHPGFVYAPARWTADGAGIEVPVRPAARTPAVCSGCGAPGPGYDTLAARRARAIAVAHAVEVLPTPPLPVKNR